MATKAEIRHIQKHYVRLEDVYVKEIEQLYMAIVTEAAYIAGSLGTDVSLDKPFSFRDHPQLNKRIDLLFKKMKVNMIQSIDSATRKEWTAAAEKNDELVDRVLKSSGLKREQVEHLYNRNLEALAAFQKRKDGNGMNLSKRVWNYTKQFKGEVEMGLDVALSEGRPAAELARDFKQYLKEPDRLFRRVRDARGNLVLSKNARNYHPGQGVYRSSYRNALRLTRSETNMSYRESDYDRWQQLDFVVGIDIQRSNHVFNCQICELFAGRYPKTFKFRGWHTSCRCFATAIMSSMNEFIEREKRRIAGEDLGAVNSANEVRDVPEGFSKWMLQNQSRISKMESKPYFIKDNLQFSGENIINSEVVALMERAKEAGPEVDRIANEIARKYGGYVTPINYKSAASIKRKVLDECNGKVEEIKDSVRNTIVLPKGKIEKAVRDIINDPRFIRVKRQLAETDPMGYSGVITNLKASNGLLTEMQINTEKMIYAKNKPGSAIKIIGKERWREIYKETGVMGGLGHKYYEAYRILKGISVEDLLKAEILEDKSRKYYEYFR